MTLLAPRSAETRLREGSALHERLELIREGLTDDESVMLDLLLDDFSAAQQTHGHGPKSMVFAVLPAADNSKEHNQLQRAMRQTACHISHIKLTATHRETMLRELFNGLVDIMKQIGIFPSQYTMCPMDNPQLTFVTFKVMVYPTLGG